jgi:hypothetical protein
MPIVLSTAEGKPRAGYVYDDRTGVSYEFPKVYDSLITVGERFVYHRPRIGYTGCGVIGVIQDSAKMGRRTCEILDYEDFEQTVSLKDADGTYYEADPAYWPTGNVYWSKGVRPLGEERYEALLKAGEVVAPPPAPGSPGGRYASPSTARAVEEYSMGIALKETELSFPGHTITPMPHNNPGFDILVGNPSKPHWYVEVKGTIAADPVFFMSEGERVFSEAHGDTYSLLVVTGINLAGKVHSHLRVHQGPVTVEIGHLEAVQWRGELSVS